MMDRIASEIQILDQLPEARYFIRVTFFRAVMSCQS